MTADELDTLRRNAGGFSLMLREDAEDLVGQILGMDASEEDSRFVFLLLLNENSERVCDLLNELSNMVRKLSNELSGDFVINAPSTQDLKRQLGTSDDFMWCCGIQKGNERVHPRILIEIAIRIFNSIVEPIHIFGIQLAAAAGITISEAYGTLAIAMQDVYNLYFSHAISKTKIGRENNQKVPCTT